LPPKRKVTAPFFDEGRNLMLLEPAHLDIKPRPDFVNYYGPIYTWRLLNLARKGNTDFELFMELHRRAKNNYNRSRVPPEDWDQAADTKEKQESNERILEAYERKWIGKVNLTTQIQDVVVESAGRGRP